jgi:arabinoxylan arabinofuranohydrolase
LGKREWSSLADTVTRGGLRAASNFREFWQVYAYGAYLIEEERPFDLGPFFDDCLKDFFGGQKMQKRVPFALVASMALSGACWADNPVVQTKFTADPAPMVYKDTVCLYTSHDEDDARGFTMYNWMCYTTTDMVNWTDHGIVGGVREPYKTFSWADGNNAWAPQCIERDGKFYLYGPFPTKGKMGIGVAVSDSPFGPFEDPLGKPLVTGSYDPTVFIDDDGQAYLYWGGNGPCYYVKLNKDMISYSGEVVTAQGKPKNYTEGPWFYKRNGHYYLAYASTCCPEGIGYAMSDKPTGPWEFKGNIMDGDKRSDGNHPGIIDFKGKSYVFGFNYKLNWEIAPAKRERRSICAAEMTYNPDGTIQKLLFWDDKGVAQVGTFNPYTQVEAATICYEKGVKTNPRSEGKQGVYVSVVDNGAWIKIKGVDFGDKGAANFSTSLGAAAQGGTIVLRIDSEVGLPIGTLKVNPTGGLDQYATQTCKVTNAKGVHDLYFKFFGNANDGAPIVNLDWWKFE